MEGKNGAENYNNLFKFRRIELSNFF